MVPRGILKRETKQGTEDSKCSLPFRGRYLHQGLHGDHLELSGSRAVVCLVQIMKQKPQNAARAHTHSGTQRHTTKTHKQLVTGLVVMHGSRLSQQPGRSHPPVPSSRTLFLSTHGAAFRGGNNSAAKKRWTRPSSRSLVRPTVDSKSKSLKQHSGLSLWLAPLNSQTPDKP